MKTIVERLEEKLEQIYSGEIDYIEAGEWLCSNGDEILNEFNWLREMLEK